jgi:hypothetical protein
MNKGGRQLKLNRKSVQEDVRKVALALVIAILVSVIINDKNLIDYVYVIIIALVLWFAGIIKPSSDDEPDITNVRIVKEKDNNNPKE